MRLKKIKLAGFKSFVDPTTVPVAANLVGIVGPNGCGKSNIIDAVRWVMGESSARNLRGESLTDVIFSGSSARKPVSQASVELIFDNTDGRAGGEYARYSEIVVRREAGRDGGSDYFLNKTRCRRKDITDLFLGTGLGPRAYSIIEQGMISRIIEARPEDLRLFLEEAAGISRYKERRRETETRLRHVRENLERLNDVRGELEQQLGRLKRQAAAAENYKAWRERERELRLILSAGQYRVLVAETGQAEERVRKAQTAHEAEIARKRAIERDTEAARQTRNEAGERMRVVREQHYAVGAEIARVEQEITHLRTVLAERRSEHQSVVRTCERLGAELAQDEQRERDLDAELKELAPRHEAAVAEVDTASAALRAAEAASDAWRRAFEQAGLAAQGPTRAYAHARSDVGRLQNRQQDLARREARLGEELRGTSSAETDGLAALRTAAALADQDYGDAQERQTGLEERLAQQRQNLDAANAALAEQHSSVKAAEARLASLGSRQAQALRAGHEAIGRWLREHGLSDAPRLATRIDAEAGWERGVERWLGPRLAAVCVPEGTVTAERVRSLADTPAILFEARDADGSAPFFGGKVKAPFALESLFAAAAPVASLEEGLARRDALDAQMMWVTPEGICIGRDIIIFAGENDERAGVLAREREIVEWTRRRDEARSAVAVAERAVGDMRAEVTQLDNQRAEARRAVDRCAQERTKAHAALERVEAEERNRSARHERVRGELAEVEQEARTAADEYRRAVEHEQQMKNEAERSEQALAALSGERAAHQSALEAARRALQAASEARHRLDMEHQHANTTRDGVRERLARVRADLAAAGKRREDLARLTDETAAAEVAPKARLDTLLAERARAQAAVAAAQQELDERDGALRQLDQAHQQADRDADQAQQQLQRDQLAAHELKVRRDALVESVRSQGFDIDLAACAAELAAGQAVADVEQEIQELSGRIARLGAVNLMAIDEYAEQSQRKTFLDAQHNDLSQALALLEEAIRKIDRETRTRFKETFDRVNTDFRTFFPRLFGCGEAHLALTGDDLLETGVSVMARPPGKRNSTIQLLSGGEKALVAVSLIFALFALNPAPFCLLDEVDAPLDEANVGRFAQTLKELAQHTQMLFITHNKITMEVAEVLLGVTAGEPGVSRLVSVDVEEALDMVAQSAGAGL